MHTTLMILVAMGAGGFGGDQGLGLAAALDEKGRGPLREPAQEVQVLHVLRRAPAPTNYRLVSVYFIRITPYIPFFSVYTIHKPVFFTYPYIRINIRIRGPWAPPGGHAGSGCVACFYVP